MHNGPVRCPNCGSQARTKGMSTTTLLAYDIKYDKNGNIVSRDPNTTTTHWKCNDCNENYVSYTQEGKEYQLR